MGRLESVCKEQDAKWLHRLSLGIDDEEVCSYSVPSSMTRLARPQLGIKNLSETVTFILCSCAHCVMHQIAVQDYEGSMYPSAPP
jgi:hypothetical protein